MIRLANLTGLTRWLLLPLEMAHKTFKCDLCHNSVGRNGATMGKMKRRTIGENISMAYSVICGMIWLVILKKGNFFVKSSRVCLAAKLLGK